MNIKYRYIKFPADKEKLLIPVLAIIIVMIVMALVVWQTNRIEVKNSDQATIPADLVVRAVNLEPIKIKDNTIKYGVECKLQQGNTITVVGIDGFNLLVRYKADRERSGFCPTGTLFFTDKQEFSRMTDQYKKYIRSESEAKDTVKKLLGEE